MATRAEPPDSLGRPQRPPQWRQLRAQVGGLERALREVQSQRDEARRQLEEYKVAKAERAWKRAGDPERVALLADLGHAADCGDPDCDRCEAILLRVEAELPRYADERLLVERLDRAEQLQAAGRSLVDAWRVVGIGRAREVAAAVARIHALLE